jgi:monoamine oxidase
VIEQGKFERSIRLNAVVRAVRWRRGHVEAADERGRRFTARRAIVTLPVPLLQARDDTRGAIRFEPEIDGTRRAASMLAAGPVVKVILRFREPFWERRPSTQPDGSLRDASFLHWRDGAFPTWWTTLPLRTPVLTGWAGGPKADALTGRGEGWILDAALRTLASIFGMSYRQVASRLDAAHACDWQSDPLSRGAYSYVRVGGGSARKQLARPVEQPLFFAGEATDTAGEAGTVAGALASGRRAAREVLRSL